MESHITHLTAILPHRSFIRTLTLDGCFPRVGQMPLDVDGGCSLAGGPARHSSAQRWIASGIAAREGPEATVLPSDATPPMTPSRVPSGVAHLFDDPRAALPHGRHSTAASGRQTAHSVAPSGAKVGIRTVVVKCCATQRRRVARASRTRCRRVRDRAPQARRPCPTHPSGDT